MHTSHLVRAQTNGKNMIFAKIPSDIRKTKITVRVLTAESGIIEISYEWRSTLDTIKKQIHEGEFAFFAYRGATLV
jgi:hypothetical protein